MPFQLSPPGSPGCAIVCTRHAIRARSRVEPDDLRPAGLRADAGAGRADHDLAAVRRAARRPMPSRTAEVADGLSHTSVPGLRVERDDVRRRTCRVEPVAVERDAALVSSAPRLARQRRAYCQSRSPVAASSACTDRRRTPARTSRRRARAASTRRSPAAASSSTRRAARRRCACDLRQRAEAVRVVAAPPGEPVAGRRLGEQRVRDRRVARRADCRPLDGGRRGAYGENAMKLKPPHGNGHAPRAAAESDGSSRRPATMAFACSMYATSARRSRRRASPALPVGIVVLHRREQLAPRSCRRTCG